MTSTAAAYDARAADYIAALGSMDAVHPVDRATVDAWPRRLRARCSTRAAAPATGRST
ncbi:hypothetical protein RWH44_08605 [Microbacterium sp. KSW2-29]|uniref:Uncharacterized protein n=1 Tax=Microbacterium phycohabitans TaxID=3075993 RepID=A0ABU3SLS8_9MICO|nr:hypothetical protein [Microbacterium sp. KSW2-29]MDU0345766.1 hypothetical protein [Microbacterium sp. KSW2-29]